jgi:fibro-slime domain-containing protein
MMGVVCDASNGWKDCATLLPDNTPNYTYPGQSPHGSVHSPASFYNWFHESNETIAIPYNLVLNSTDGHLFEYQSLGFFPLDGRGWNDSQIAYDGNYHNFAFCLEIHGSFSYRGGEIFFFEGDDDMYVYLDRRLVIDLGGVHNAESANISLDAIAGLVRGQTYDFDMFYCERHSTASDLRLSTSISIQTCGGARCASSNNKAVLIGAITGGIVAAIAIGAALFLGITAYGGRKAYGYIKPKLSSLGAVHGNPLYKGTTQEGDNPLYTQQ